MEKGSPDSYLSEEDARKGINLSCLINLLNLFLVFVIALLIILPNLLPASKPAPAANANREMRLMSVAMESYYIDHNQYPYPAMGSSWAVVSDGGVSQPAVGYTPHSLTTPIVHIASLPKDPFNTSRSYDPNIPSTFCFRYATTPITCWILCSNGPDGDADFDLKEYVDLKNGAGCDIGKYLSHQGGKWIEYDPTNGMKSNGDLFRTGP